MAKKKATAPKTTTVAPASAALLEATRKAQQLITEIREEWLPKIKGGSYYGKRVENCGPGKWMLGQDRDIQAVMVSAVLDEIVALEQKMVDFRATLTGDEVHNPYCKPGWYKLCDPWWVLVETLTVLLRRQLPLTEKTDRHGLWGGLLQRR
jgi:hypothetical protein